ncbi:hypothetical protein [Streptomyces sp. NBC_00102]|uniref:effector-associated domain 2-containing protein n=1 Tax=Streptomyces sp. NBC_00102 TaxID=2975652 RepID=UPI002258A37E|nr:hypothetical protein [Streptomyces sp. NBC_00102]MCX5400544.1 hypothetical protein [Streptomyces sp. NBC_00102]
MAVGDGAVSEDAWRLRIVGRADVPVGCAVLLPDSLVVTCAHVVVAACSGPEAGSASGRGTGPVAGDAIEDAATDARFAEILVDFPGSLLGGRMTASVVRGGWAPAVDDRAGDVAVLRLHGSPPPDVLPARLRWCGESHGRVVSAFAEPAGPGSGGWARAVLAGAGGLSPDWIQLDAGDPAGPRFVRGYSGAGVRDQTSGSVLGTMVAVRSTREQTTAWMNPTEALVRYCPVLRDIVEPEAPGPRTPADDSLLPSLAWQTEAERRLTTALVRVPSMRDTQRRDRIIGDIGPEIMPVVARSPSLIEDIRAVVAVCLQYPDAVDRLAAAVRWYENASLPMREFERVWAQVSAERR